MNNRIPFFNRGGNGKGGRPPQSSKEEAERMVKEIQQKKDACLIFGAQIYDMITPGMTLELNLPLRGQIITPDKPQQFGRLLITKPLVMDRLTGKIRTDQPKP